MNVLSKRIQKNEMHRKTLGTLYLCIAAAILTADDLWGVDQKATDTFVTAFGEVLNGYSEEGEVEFLRQELEDRGIAINIGNVFSTKPDNKKYERGYKLPCKIGDEVWAIKNYKGHEEPRKGVVNEMYFTDKMEIVVVVHHLVRGIWGDRVFKTKEETEKAIAERANSR